MKITYDKKAFLTIIRTIRVEDERKK